VIEIDENDITTVIFGDGIYGLIPPTGSQIIATYRSGGGKIGNVPAGTINTITNAPDLTALADEVINESAATGGEEQESIENAIRFAPLVFKSNQRAVTVEDYLGLAKKFPGVAKARAEAGNWNQINLYIAPSGEKNLSDMMKKEPVVSDVMKKELLEYFEDKRMLTTRIEIIDPEYVPIFITARVTAKSYAFNSDVEADVQKSIESILRFDVVDFKQNLFLSKIYEAIEALPGVDSVYVTEFKIRDAEEDIAPKGTISLNEYQIPIPGYDNFINVTVEGGL
ncbi:MAG: baseplate J/gp47 family protein, partial [Proteobacteria bacterium]|nr:baseplate J/gp47 family protein [Pseudomonadota bacterium]